MKNTYDFCPKCGAIVRNGACISCGTVYGETEEVGKKAEEGQENLSPVPEEEILENQAEGDLPEVEESGMEGQPEIEAEKQPETEEQPEIEAEKQPETEGQPVMETEKQPETAMQPGMGGYMPAEPARQEQNPESRAPHGDYNYYGGQSPAGYSESGKKKNTGLLIGALAGTFLIIIILIIYIGFEIAKLSKGNFMADVKQSIDDIFTEQPEQSERIEQPEEKEYPIDSEADEDYWDEYGKEQSLQYDENFKEERKNYDASQITGPYYEDFVNCIDESVSYKVNREFFEKIQEEQGVCIQVSYIQLEGDIPNLEAINEKIKDESMFYANVYLEKEDYYQEVFKNYDYMTHKITVESFVTLNDEESISIVLDERYEVGGYSNLIQLCGLNINLKTGIVLDNTEILNMDEEFVKDFDQRSNKQNGTDSFAIEGISDSEKLQMFQNEENLILFYTPVGLEVGFNYFDVDGYTGWITVSIEDYEQYLKGY
ncbi:MAG: hypothetical protein HDR01_13910 [Lachnospiraceae bacterium]|nr:hypothetical protein [Lachnospiraceae bacterium]